MALSLEEAYEILHLAIQQLGPTRPRSDCPGETAVETARTAITALQLALLVKMDGIDVKEPAVSVLRVPMQAATLEAITRLARTAGEETPELTAARILETWLRDQG